jgi:hypothetical protein
MFAEVEANQARIRDRSHRIYINFSFPHTRRRGNIEINAALDPSDGLRDSLNSL